MDEKRDENGDEKDRNLKRPKMDEKGMRGRRFEG